MALKLNGPDGSSLRGHVFDPQDEDSMPGFARRMSPEQREAWATAETERMRIAANCEECGLPLIAEEVLAHYMNEHVSSRNRALVRTVMARTPEQRDEVLANIKALTALEVN